MAGNRYLLANYLRILGLDPEDTGKLVGLLVEQPSYPSRATVLNWLCQCGLPCEEKNLIESELRQVDDIFLALLNSDDISYVLVLHTGIDSLVYLTGTGQIKKELYTSFCPKWTGSTIFIGAFGSQQVKARLQIKLKENKKEINLHPKISDIRKVTLSNEPLAFRPCRYISIYFSYFFVRTKIHPNLITFSWLFPILAAGALFAQGNTWVIRISAVLLILLGFTLDCSDGEVARLTRQFTTLGGYLDTLIHWISGPIIIVGVTAGIYHTGNDPATLITGLLCIAGDSTYTYVSLQINYWRNQNSPYGVLIPSFLPLFWLYPLNINIFLIGAIFNQLPKALRLWEYLSFILAILIAITFLFQEKFKKDKR